MADKTGVSIAFRRSADILLRGAGTRTIKLRIPAFAIPGDPAEQLGLAVPQFQDIELAPSAFRTSAAKTQEGKANERELIVSAEAVEKLAGSHDYASARVLFASAFGVLVDDALLTIVSVTEQEAGGRACAYRLTLREETAAAV